MRARGPEKAPGMLLIALWLCAAASPAAAQWARVEAVPVGDVLTVRTQGDTIVAGTLTLAYTSVDGGAHWHPSAPIDAVVTPVQALLMRNGTLYAGTGGRGVFSSTDLGSTWSAFNAGLVGGFFDSQLDVSDLEVRGDSLYASTFGAGVYVRNLAGADLWHHFGEEFEPNQASNVRALTVGGARLLADAGGNGSVFVRDPGDADWRISWLDNVGLRPGLQAFSSTWTGSTWVVATGVGRGVFSSALGQEPWTFVNLGLGRLNSGTVTARGHRVFGAFNRDADAVIEQSIDGASWEPLDDLPGVLVFEMATHGADLYAARADGLWVRSTATLSVHDRSPHAGLHFELAGRQPASDQVRMRFELPRSGPAKLEVFDISGRRVTERVWPSLPVGVQELAWSAADLRPGIYVARLSAAERREALRLVLAR